MSDTDQTSDVAALTVQLLSAYLANNTVSSEDLAELIRSTKSALTEEAAQIAAPVESETFTPAVSARKSLASPDHIISLIDGKPYKTLKRHLASHGLTPETYRSRYNLPASYPMVAPTYAAHRRAVAQKIGLGSRRAAVEAVEESVAPAPESLPDVPAATTPDKPEPKTRQPRQATAKATGRGRKKKVDPSNEDGAPQAEPSQASEPASTADADESAATMPKRSAPTVKKASANTKASKPRGKIGLFKKANAGDGAPTNTEDQPQPAAVSETSQADSNELKAEPESPAKPAKAKRMARAPKRDAT